jgi:hypothetical protein
MVGVLHAKGAIEGTDRGYWKWITVIMFPDFET